MLGSGYSLAKYWEMAPEFDKTAIDIVKILLEHGAIVNTRDVLGKLHTIIVTLFIYQSLYIYIFIHSHLCIYIIPITVLYTIKYI